MFVKGREFLACRLYRKIGGNIYVAARSFEIDEIPETKGKVRCVIPSTPAFIFSDPQQILYFVPVCVLC